VILKRKKSTEEEILKRGGDVDGLNVFDWRRRAGGKKVRPAPSKVRFDVPIIAEEGDKDGSPGGVLHRKGQETRCGRD